MELQWLRDHIHELKLHLEHFQLMLHQLEVMYQRSMRLHTNPDLRSMIMERYSIHLNRQRKSVEAMRKLYEQARSQLCALEARRG